MDGGIEGRPDNVIFYATSTRRHLMPRDRIENERSSAIRGSLWWSTLAPWGWPWSVLLAAPDSCRRGPSCRNDVSEREGVIKYTLGFTPGGAPARTHALGRLLTGTSVSDGDAGLGVVVLRECDVDPKDWADLQAEIAERARR